VIGFLRVMATLRRLLEESGDPEQLAKFDLAAWVAQWMREPLPELGTRHLPEMLLIVTDPFLVPAFVPAFRGSRLGSATRNVGGCRIPTR